MTSDQEWGLFQNLHWENPRPFAAIVIKRTDKRIIFAKAEDPEDHIMRESDWLLAGGLTKEQATAAADKLKDSLRVMEAETRAARANHHRRRDEIVKALTHD